MENEEFILGYQWSQETKKYMGEYRFPNNKDKEEIHMPPFTTLIEPPLTLKGQTAFWDDGVWIVRETPATHPPIEDYSSLRLEYINQLKEDGSWSEEDEKNHQDALKKIEDDQNNYKEELGYYEEEFRFIRNMLLEKSDWTQMPDIQKKFTENEKEQLIIYRQKLRDLPQNIEDAKAMVLDLNHSDWPISPL